MTSATPRAHSSPDRPALPDGPGDPYPAPVARRRGSLTMRLLPPVAHLVRRGPAGRVLTTCAVVALILALAPGAVGAVKRAPNAPSPAVADSMGTVPPIQVGITDASVIE